MMHKPTIDPQPCASCRYASACTLKEDRSSFQLSCEHYAKDNDHLRQALVNHFSARGLTAWGAPEKPGGCGGLCTDCVYHDGCVLSDPEGGVWQCTEYEQRQA